MAKRQKTHIKKQKVRGTGSRKATEKKGVETDVLTEVKEMAVFTHWGLITQQNTDRNKGQAKKKMSGTNNEDRVYNNMEEQDIKLPRVTEQK